MVATTTFVSSALTRCNFFISLCAVLFVVLQAFEELEELLARHNICIAIKEKLVKDSGVAEDIAYDNIVQKLLTKPRARGKCQNAKTTSTKLKASRKVKRKMQKKKTIKIRLKIQCQPKRRKSIAHNRLHPIYYDIVHQLGGKIALIK